MKIQRIAVAGAATAFGLLGLLLAQLAFAEAVRRPEEGPQPSAPLPEVKHEAPTMSPGATPVEVQRDKFGPDRIYVESAYDPKAQYDVYGAKHAVDRVAPLLELGQPLYAKGLLSRPRNIVGEKNLVAPQLYAYGDFRTVAAYNENGKTEIGQAATRLNIDVDLKLTATERMHALFRPFDRDGQFSRCEFAGKDRNRDQKCHAKFNGRPDTAFFEGDLGAITAGLTDKYVGWDLPFAFGLIPLVMQNGVWVDDAFVGAAVSIPAKNSPSIDISNFDVTFFAGKGKVSSGAIRNRFGKLDNDAAAVYGIATFMDTQRGYLEAGYGYTQDTRSGGSDFSYHNVTASFTKRYAGIISNSVRLIYNFGQSPGKGAKKTADGGVLLIENSFITRLPSTLIPYANFFVGFKKPQSLLRDAGAGGVLKNTGLSFETDNLTGFPKLDDTANDTFGGAVGLQYLFNLNQQIVVEAAALNVIGRDNKPGRNAKGDAYALSFRYQHPITNAWIFRADGIVAMQDQARDLKGIRVELRRKF